MSAQGETFAVRFHDVHNQEGWRYAAAVAIAAALRRDLAELPRARLLVSGGLTPAPVLDALSKAPLDWQRVDISLVDERWLLPTDPSSNAHLVRTHLLCNHASNARFEPLARPGMSIEASANAANLNALHPPGVIVLGMGNDAHVASLFPGMKGLEAALASTLPYVSVDATGCPGAGAWSRRVSLTPAGLAPAHTRLLLLRGVEKRELFQQALSGTDAVQMPVRIAFTTPGAGLDVYWAP